MRRRRAQRFTKSAAKSFEPVRKWPLARDVKWPSGHCVLPRIIRVAARSEGVEREANVALQLKDHCQKCAGELPPEAEAYICTFECTFCPACTGEMRATCPNRGGELVRRPRLAGASLREN